MALTIDLFIDWKSATNGQLRPQRLPKTKPPDAEILIAVLGALRANLERLLGTEDVIIDTYLYGGFTAPDGTDAEEFVLLNEALSRAKWTGRSGNSLVRYREVIPVNFARPDNTSHRLNALFRPRLRVTNARVRVRGATCACKWLTLTEKWLDPQHPNSYSQCPECDTTRIELEREGQKMVDTLLTAHLVHRAALRSQQDDPSEIWVLSDDSDILPAVCAASALGIAVRWLQTRPMRRHGYREVVLANDVTISEVTYVGT